MVKSRVVLAKKPQFLYGTRGYSVLFFGVSVRGEFTTQRAKECLAGKFPSKTGHNDFLVTAKQLTKAGLLYRIDTHTWRVTKAGVRAMSEAAAYRREYCYRTLGATYMDSAYERMKKIHDSMTPIIEKLDMESEVLDEIEDKMNRKREMKSKAKRARKTRAR